MIPSSLQKNSVLIIEQLIGLLEQIEVPLYQESLSVLSGGAINKHVRHIIEFYTCLFAGLSTGEVNYDARERNVRIENDPAYAIRMLQVVRNAVQNVSEDRTLFLKVSYVATEEVRVPTTLYRELIYNLEHGIHHMATIRIGLGASARQYPLSETFGVAPSTIQHQQATCAP